MKICARAVVSVTQGANGGTVAITGGGTGVSYTPNSGFTGVDTFDYHVGDGMDDSNVAAVTLNVNDTQAPVVTCSLAKATRTGASTSSASRPPTRRTT